jgi:hypothetical protein
MTTKNMLSNRVYDLLNVIAIFWIPAISTFYFTISSLWGLPNTEAIVGSMAALATFLGTLVRMSKKSYNANDNNFDGVINVTMPTPDSTLYSLELNGDPADINKMKNMNFKVNPYSGD